MQRLFWQLDSQTAKQLSLIGTRQKSQTDEMLLTCRRQAVLRQANLKAGSVK